MLDASSVQEFSLDSILIYNESLAGMMLVSKIE